MVAYMEQVSHSSCILPKSHVVFELLVSLAVPEVCLQHVELQPRPVHRLCKLSSGQVAV